MLLASLAVLTLTLAPQEESTLQKLEKDVAAVVERIRPSVVRVHVDKLTFSGVIYSREGHIITDATGLDHAGEIRVTVQEKAYAADRVAADRRTGVAVLKISAKGLTPASICPDACKPGTTALVVGNPLGLTSSFSTGTIGGTGRSILVRGRKYENMLQMSGASVQPGDCGALVADASGHLVGLVHSAAAPEAGEEKPAPLLAFAVPAAWVKFSADRIIQHGRMVRGWLGASLLPLTDSARAQLGLEPGVGAEVAHVDRDSPAAKAGLATRDIIVSMGDEPVKDLDALQWKVARIEKPTPIKLSFLHNRELRQADTQIELDPQK
ncbi:MAG: trypsin-like peptidase domain-containing protein [Planctomycetaceae bacterium]|nr:trypsin-like peptidase domain-containing protein [Planctomycetaceae bacterium]